MSKWKLVPSEPTDEMVMAGSEGDPQFFEHARFVWRAMLASAPDAPTADGIKPHDQREMVNRIRDRIKAGNPAVPKYLRELVSHAVADELAHLRKPDAPAVQAEPVAWMNWNAATGKCSVSFDCESELASQPLYEQPAAGSMFKWPKLDAPAKVGGAIFGSGVSTESVIKAAKRHAAEHRELSHEEKQAAERARRELWDKLNGSPYDPPAPQQTDVLKRQFLSDVITAAGLLSHGKTDKALAKRIAEYAFSAMTQPDHAQKLAEALRDVQWEEDQYGGYRCVCCWHRQGEPNHDCSLVAALAAYEKELGDD